jgi:hypothetical protein
MGAARSFCASEPDLVYLDGQQAVLDRSKLSPFPGRNFEAMDPLEGLARMSDHIPDPGPHRTPFYGEYANRVRGERHPPEAEEVPGGRRAATQALLAPPKRKDRRPCARACVSPSTARAGACRRSGNDPNPSLTAPAA